MVGSFQSTCRVGLRNCKMPQTLSRASVMALATVLVVGVALRPVEGVEGGAKFVLAVLRVFAGSVGVTHRRTPIASRKL
jgi:hypothetical protein